jgi:N-acetylglucosaminyl-diphospho-decaprenol L-rhamnosyltransferase
MIVSIGIILYKANLEIICKALNLFSRQIRKSSDFTLFIYLLDNDNGNQEKEVCDLINNLNLPISIKYFASENIGFGKGHNKIFSIVKQDLTDNFDYYLCFNHDAIPHPLLLNNLLQKALETNDKGIYEAVQSPEEHPKVYNPETGETNWCSGACLLFPKEVYELLNGFDPNFFMYIEDVDISWRNKLLGNKCYLVNSAIVNHFVNVEERATNKINTWMYESGYKLSYKWKNARFMDEMLEALSKTLSEEEITKLKNECDKISIINLIPNDININFDCRFSFSEVRW